MPAEARYLERERQGRENEFPLPVGPSPGGDIHTVQCQRIGGKEPGTAARRLHPGYGCSPDIASTAPAPSWGRGRSAAGAGGVGLPARSKMVGV